jgi:hypothetical protein
MKKTLFTILAFLFIALSNLSAQHVKKDGTPDMRYKENKNSYSVQSSSSSSSSTSNSGVHLKKDGTPDMRYKENKTSFHLPSSSHSSAGSPSYHSNSTQTHSSSTSYSSTSSAVKRDANGRIVRSSSAKHEFEVMSGYPHGRPGYVVDHINPLKRGGCDCPSNMQWQTIADAKAKDKWE